jgi:hypothetical protein
VQGETLNVTLSVWIGIYTQNSLFKGVVLDETVVRCQRWIQAKAIGLQAATSLAFSVGV